MILPNPVSITRSTGQTDVISELYLTFHDHNKLRLVTVAIAPHLGGLTLWSGEEYDAIGDWTQSQAEARILELLGEDLQSGLQALVAN